MLLLWLKGDGMKEYEVYINKDCICMAKDPCQHYKECKFAILIEDKYYNSEKEMASNHIYNKINGRWRQKK